MKNQKQILLFLMLFFAGSVFAQFAPFGATWYYSYNGDMGYQQYNSIGDSVSVEDGKTYQIVEGVKKYPFMNSPSRSRHILYQENNRVYLLFKNELYLLYDFEAEIGKEYIFYARSYELDEYATETVLPVKYRIEKITKKIVEGSVIKHFEGSLIEDDSYVLHEEYIYPTVFSYNEKTGSEDEFILFVSLPRPAIVDSRLRCYSDLDISYTSEYWSESCDYVDPQYYSLDGIENDNVTIDYFQNEKRLSVKSKLHEVSFKVYDTKGILQIEKTILQEEVISLSGLFPGLYCIAVSCQGKVYLQKLII